MALNARYLADKSALARLGHAVVAQRLRTLMEDGHVARCAIVDLEILFSSRNLSNYEEILEERQGFPDVPVTPDVMAGAIDLQHELARTGQHRLPIADLVISAAARSANLTVLHYDAEFERIRSVGGANHEWVAPRGSL